MLQLPRGFVTPQRKNVAIVVALVVDAIQMAGWPMFVWGGLFPGQDGLDLVAAAILLTTLGFRWPLVVAFFIELVPGLALFPTWTAFVLMIPTHRADQLPPPVIGTQAPPMVTATRVPPVALPPAAQRTEPAHAPEGP